MTARRVVVTGYGVFSPLGNTVEAFWKSIKEGNSGIKKIKSDDYNNSSTKIAGYITDFDADQSIDKKEKEKTLHYGCVSFDKDLDFFINFSTQKRKINWNNTHK